jgi:hypothetical protein
MATINGNGGEFEIVATLDGDLTGLSAANFDLV